MENIVQASWNGIEMSGRSGSGYGCGGGGVVQKVTTIIHFWITVTKQLDLFMNKNYDLYNI